jgi:hypothetical protein
VDRIGVWARRVGYRSYISGNMPVLLSQRSLSNPCRPTPSNVEPERVLGRTATQVEIDKLTDATPTQRRAFELIDSPIPLTTAA